MHPILFQVDDFPVHTYGVLYLAAFLVAIVVTAKLATRSGVPFGRMVDVAFMIAIAGEVGARLTFVIVEWERFAAGAISLRQFLVGGRVVLGGVVVGIAFAIWLFRRYKLPVAGVLDAVLTGTALGMGIGRLGCLAAGCCFGKPTDWWWGITFTDPLAEGLNGTPLGVALQPTQILQAIEGFVFFAFLLWLFHRRRFQGQIAATFLVLAGLSRFGMEFLRGDPRGAAVGISTSQWIGLVMVAGGILWLWLGYRSSPENRLPEVTPA
jgi:phosphatidylglycerol:prolipoprotein diacylglycerol transferase